ncbi:hypothetical protein AGMMS50276_16700 [Synergistales bacterium]|nr:hypothetical protein AGMMS50276_16700 [Synergistales bacterium]
MNKEMRRTSVLSFMSFGFKYGIPSDVNFLFDVRFLRNPFYVPELKPLSGKDEPVKQYLSSFPEMDKFLDSCENFLRPVAHAFFDSERNVRVAFACTGGRHRSVFCAESMTARFGNLFAVEVFHRDIDKYKGGESL